MALNYLHQSNILHRDIKPSNIFLKSKEYTVQIGDFGIAAQTEGVVIEDVGSLAYQAPEMLDGSQHDARTDIWSLRCVIYSLCQSGGFPFDAHAEARLVEKIKSVGHKPLD